MKISTRRMLMMSMAGAGLFALLLAYRTSPPKTSATFDLGSATIPSTDIALGNQSFEPAADFNVSVQFEENQIASSELELDLEVPAFSESTETQPLTLADSITLESQEPASEPTTLSKSKGWQSNPFLGSDRRNSTAELVSAELELEGSSQVEVVGSVLAESNVAPIEVEMQAVPATQATEFSQSVVEPTSVVSGLSESAAHKAVHHIEYGKSLARRNASEAASQEFLTALRILAESNDSVAGGNRHTEALRSGMLAMKEAEDFKVDDPQRQIIVNVANVMEGHETQLFGADQARSMTATDATHHYLIYAGEQLGRCGGQNVVAAEALYCLGKMRSISAQESSDPESMDLTQAIIYHHASLTADPSNYRSANELGVLLARNGQLSEAESFLKSSLRIKQMPQSWANLAKVHQRKGTQQDMQLANMAMNEYQTALHNENATISGAIQWVEPVDFIARSATEYPEGMPTNQPAVQSAVMPAANIESGVEKKSFVEKISNLIPKSIRR